MKQMTRAILRQSVDRMREIARSWGGDLVTSNSKLYKRLAHAPGFARCPDVYGLGVHYNHRLIVSGFPIVRAWHVPILAHEMWHVFGTKYPPRYGPHDGSGDEAPVEWELAVLKRIGFPMKLLKRVWIPELPFEIKVTGLLGRPKTLIGGPVNELTRTEFEVWVWAAMRAGCGGALNSLGEPRCVRWHDEVNALDPGRATSLQANPFTPDDMIKLRAK